MAENDLCFNLLQNKKRHESGSRDINEEHLV